MLNALNMDPATLQKRLGLLVVPGMATATYELLMGKSVSVEDANYFFAALAAHIGILNSHGFCSLLN